jgi:hypothetical protein
LKHCNSSVNLPPKQQIHTITVEKTKKSKVEFDQ